MSFEDCIVIFENFVVEFKENSEEFVIIIVCEIGKLFWEICIEVGVMMGKIVIFIKVYYECMGMIENFMLGVKVFICYKLYGVVVVFGLYNFLGYLLNGYIVFVILVGNMVVFKLLELMFYVVEFILKFWLKVGLLVGVINFV